MIVTLRIDDELVKKIDAAAKDADRSRSYLIVRVLEKEFAGVGAADGVVRKPKAKVAPKVVESAPVVKVEEVVEKRPLTDREIRMKIRAEKGL